MAIDRSEVKQIADAAIRHYIDAIRSADSELPRYIREEILRPYGQEGGTGDREIG